MATSSTNNSTDTPLVASASFTGTADAVLPYQRIHVAVKADQPSTLYLEWSTNDGTDWDASNAFAVPSGRHFTTTAARVAGHFRVRLTCGDVGPMSFLRLKTLLDKEELQAPTTITSLQELGAGIAAVQVGSGAGKLLSCWVSNEAASDPAFAKIYIQAAAVDAATDTPVATLFLPAATSILWAPPGGVSILTGQQAFVRMTGAAAADSVTPPTGPASWVATRS